MHVGESTEIGHTGLLISHFLHSLICLCDTSIHCLLRSLHLRFYFLYGFNMTIIFSLFHWFSWYSWFHSHLLLLKSNFFLNCLFTCNQHLLELSGLSFCFGYCLDVFSILIYSWIFSCLFIGKSLLLSLILGFFSSFLSWRHF